MKCNIENCEYNNNGKCIYCGDYRSLNDENCISFIDKNDEDIGSAMLWNSMRENSQYD